MRVCLMVEGQEGVSWDEWLALARGCEQHGLEGLFRSDHYVSITDEESRGSLDAWATLSGLAATTSSIRLGTMVSPSTFRHPSVLAKMVTTADHISGGRVELGLGAGWFEREHTAYGFPFPNTRTRIEMLSEQLEIVHGEWTREEFDFSGKHYAMKSLRALPKPRQEPHPNLIVGGSGGHTSVDLAARWADEYNTVSPTVERCRELRADLDEACRSRGRDPASLVLSVMTTCIVGADRGDFEELGRAVLELSRRDQSLSEYVRSAGEERVLGTAEEAVDKLRRYEDAGVQRIMLQHLAHRELGMIEVLGRDVIPGLGSAS